MQVTTSAITNGEFADRYGKRGMKTGCRLIRFPLKSAARRSKP